MKESGFLFDDYVMVDWSGAANARANGGKDTVWLAHGRRESDVVRVENPASRPAAVGLASEILGEAVAAGRRVLIGFDFAYGYPAGLAARMGLSTDDTPAWQAVWRLLHALADHANFGGGDSTGEVDRFAMASELNRRFIERQPGLALGPWWGRTDWTVSAAILSQLPKEVVEAAPFAKGKRKGGGRMRRNICKEHGVSPATYPCLPMTSPGYPFAALPRLRSTEQVAGGAQETWKVCGIGSVGSQALTGIPRLHQLLTDPELAACSRVWPFTTGFADPTAGSEGPLVVHAEVFPSCIDVDYALHQVRDACQVESLVRLARERDANGSLLDTFRTPEALAGDDAAIQRAVAEEGWILFAENDGE